MNIFFLMIQLFTKVPISKEITFDQKKLSRGIIFFPLIGLFIGLIVSIPTYLADMVFGREVSATIMIISVAALTGALHLDGLADTMDGILSARSKDKMLLIMKDSRIGTHGVLVLIFTIILKYLFLRETQAGIYIVMVMALPVVGRTAMSVMLLKSKYAREEGLGNIFIGKTRDWESIVSGILGMIIIFSFLGVEGVIAFTITLIFIFLFRLRIEKMLGGLTGDTLGAINELSELIYLPLYIIMERGGLFL